MFGIYNTFKYLYFYMKDNEKSYLECVIGSLDDHGLRPRGVRVLGKCAKPGKDPEAMRLAFTFILFVCERCASIHR